MPIPGSRDPTTAAGWMGPTSMRMSVSVTPAIGEAYYNLSAGLRGIIQEIARESIRRIAADFKREVIINIEKRGLVWTGQLRSSVRNVGGRTRRWPGQANHVGVYSKGGDSPYKRHTAAYAAAIDRGPTTRHTSLSVAGQRRVTRWAISKLGLDPYNNRRDRARIYLIIRNLARRGTRFHTRGFWSAAVVKFLPNSPAVAQHGRDAQTFVEGRINLRGDPNTALRTAIANGWYRAGLQDF